MKTITAVPIGESCIVKQLHGEGGAKRRRMEKCVNKGGED